MMTNPRFQKAKTEAAAAVSGNDPRSVYTGIVHENGGHEYYFGTDTEETTNFGKPQRFSSVCWCAYSPTVPTALSRR